MRTATQILNACTAAGVIVWREGDKIRVRATVGPIPARLQADLRSGRAALFDVMPDGFGWHGNFYMHAPVREAVSGLARFLDWPQIRVEHLDGRKFSVSRSAWDRFIRDADECLVIDAGLVMDAIYLAREMVAGRERAA